MLKSDLVQTGQVLTFDLIWKEKRVPKEWTKGLPQERQLAEVRPLESSNFATPTK